MKLFKICLIVLLASLYLQGCKKVDLPEKQAITKQYYESNLECIAYIKDDSVILNNKLPKVEEGRQVLDCFLVKNDNTEVTRVLKETVGTGTARTGKGIGIKVSDFIKAHGEGEFYYLVSYRIVSEDKKEIIKGAFRSNTFKIKNS